ncbi:MAG: SDR family oxidoreductase [Anaerolineales bacterium]|nr:SDR family oxidoreductase [Anaerolineales bacterium]
MPNLRFAAPVEARVAVVTGGALGIGRAAAVRLAEAGRDVVVADLAPEAAETVKLVEAQGRRAAWHQVDVTDAAAVQALVDATVADFGRLDILVCCAGVLGSEVGFLDLPFEQFERILSINLYGVFHAHQAAIPAMLRQGWGRCVTIGSGARHGVAQRIPYSVSKGAVRSLIASLGAAYVKQGVFVNGIEPGRVLTQMIIPRFSAAHLANPGVPIGRYSDPEEVAEVIEFLASERNTYTSGVFWEVQNTTR